ncbi:MAG TPA: OsmC family protein [Pseudonocardiaceae bacterium]|jgi:uncharacterized OsmC-like protein|nr:OsmC family protein [Pseudonocardiaceae bacterium]
MSLADLIEETRQAMSDNPANAVESFRATSTLAPNTATLVKVQIGDHVFAVDEPAALGGTDSAASPVEYALAALSSCLVITYQFWSAMLDIPLDAVHVTVDGDLDLRGVFGLGDIRPGFTDVRVSVELHGPASAQSYEHLRQLVNEHCPVVDLFRNPTPVTIT